MCRSRLHAQSSKAKDDYEAVLKLDPSCVAAQQYVEKAEAEAARRARTGRGVEGEGDAAAEEEEEEEIDPYEVLGLERKCGAAEIKSAFRKLALKYHPDKHADEGAEAQAEAEGLFQQVNLANTLLSDPYKRRQYDAGGRVRDVMK
jgi:DnaJ-class molecular chaperone